MKHVGAVTGKPFEAQNLPMRNEKKVCLGFTLKERNLPKDIRDSAKVEYILRTIKKLKLL